MKHKDIAVVLRELYPSVKEKVKREWRPLNIPNHSIIA